MTESELRPCRGIKNVSGVSCHISSTLHLIHHCIPSLREALIDLADALTPSGVGHSGPNIDFIWQLGLLFKELSDTNKKCTNETSGTNDFYSAVDPTPLYDVLPPSLDYKTTGDAATALRAILMTLRSGSREIQRQVDTDKRILETIDYILTEGCFCGTTIERVEATKRLVMASKKNTSGRRIKLMKRRKPDRERPMTVPFAVPVKGNITLSSALQSVTIDGQRLVGYNWENVTDFLQTEEVVEEENNPMNEECESSSSSSSSSNESSDDDSSTTSVSSDTSSSSSSSSVYSSSSTSSDEEDGTNTMLWKTKKYTQLNKLPKYLFLQLKRFEYINCKVKILSDRLDVPMNLDVSPFSVEQSNESVRYVLHGAIVFTDDPIDISASNDSFEDAGHYTSFIRLQTKTDIDDKEQCDDVLCAKMSECGILDSEEKKKRVQQYQWIEINDEEASFVKPHDKIKGNGKCVVEEESIEDYVANVLSGRLRKNVGRGRTSNASKFATLLLYQRLDNDG